MFMVLSREGAVDGWRQEIGPTDPELAKTEAPESYVFLSNVLYIDREDSYEQKSTVVFHSQWILVCVER